MARPNGPATATVGSSSAARRAPRRSPVSSSDVSTSTTTSPVASARARLCAAPNPRSVRCRRRRLPRRRPVVRRRRRGSGRRRPARPRVSSEDRDLGRAHESDAMRGTRRKDLRLRRWVGRSRSSSRAWSINSPPRRGGGRAAPGGGGLPGGVSRGPVVLRPAGAQHGRAGGGGRAGPPLRRGVRALRGRGDTVGIVRRHGPPLVSPDPRRRVGGAGRGGSPPAPTS